MTVGNGASINMVGARYPWTETCMHLGFRTTAAIGRKLSLLALHFFEQNFIPRFVVARIALLETHIGTDLRPPMCQE